MIARKIFFAGVRMPVFGGRMTQGQVAGMEAILGRFERRGWGDPRGLAYMLATAHHETAGRMQPVRETLAGSDADALAILERAWRGGRLPWVSAPYWRRDADGRTWLGRGLVQLTHRRNYVAMSRLAGVDLVADPDLALRPDVAVTILFAGMTEGAFTGHRLKDYFDGSRADWVGARRIINGLESAEKVAATAQAFDAALRAALEAAAGATVGHSAGTTQSTTRRTIMGTGSESTAEATSGRPR